MPRYLPFLVDKAKAGSIARVAAWSSDPEITGQFLWSACGGEDGKTKCITLRDSQSQQHIAFVGLTLSTEDLGSMVNVFVSVEFVYVHEDVRGRGLSKHFIPWVASQLIEWLDAGMNGWTGRDVVLFSASNPKTDGGAAFLERLERELRPIARARHLAFSSCIDER